MSDLLRIDLLNVFVEHKMLPEIVLRNEKIRYEFNELKNSGMSSNEAKMQLSEKYFLSIKAIEYIVYKNKNFRKIR
ncbi:MAG: hypothetical protein K8F36_14720 [Melioribacteraceae bacterium]|nr:hypothetical protein [Melioribacteraceae bacterium]